MPRIICIVYDDLDESNRDHNSSGVDHRPSEHTPAPPEPKADTESKSIFDPHLELGMP
jgi:hypothetical protein